MSVDPAQVEGVQILYGIVAKAVVDKTFRKKLEENPRRELETAGLEVPKDVNVKVLVNTETELYLVIPSCPPLVSDEKNVKVLFSSFHWI